MIKKIINYNVYGKTKVIKILQNLLSRYYIMYFRMQKNVFFKIL